MTKEELSIKISDCFDGRSCIIKYDPLDHYGWLDVHCGSCIFPDDLFRLRNILYISNISSTIDFQLAIPVPDIVISCCYKDVIDYD